jgi:hypothetical protein
MAEQQQNPRIRGPPKEPLPPCTALFIASQEGHLATAEALLAAGADPKQAKVDGSTALHISSQLGNVDIVRTLVKAGVRKWTPERHANIVLILQQSWNRTAPWNCTLKSAELLPKTPEHCTTCRAYRRRNIPSTCSRMFSHTSSLPSVLWRDLGMSLVSFKCFTCMLASGQRVYDT